MQKFLKPLLAVKTKSGFSILSVIVVTLVSTWVLINATKAEVVIAANGDVQVVKTNMDTVGELLDDLGINVGKYDVLSHGENTEIEDGMEIYFETAKKIFLTIDGETEEYYTTAVTVGEFFEEEELTFSKHDDVSHNDMAVLDEEFEIEVTTAFPVIIHDGTEEEVKVWTTGGTVEELLEKHKEDLTYEEADEIKVEPNLDEKLTKKMEITIIHVEKEKLEVRDSIPFKEETQNDSSLFEGETKTVTEGEEGIVEKTYEITLENGKEVTRELIDEEIIKESKNKVVAVGTKEKPKQTTSKSSNNSSSSSSGKEFVMEATAYGPDCKGCSGVSATGVNLKKSPTPKVVSVDPNVIPLGSRVWVEGYGEAIAADTGGAIKGNRIDVLVESEDYARKNWGRKTVKVRVLD